MLAQRSGDGALSSTRIPNAFTNLGLTEVNGRGNVDTISKKEKIQARYNQTMEKVNQETEQFYEKTKHGQTQGSAWIST